MAWLLVAMCLASAAQAEKADRSKPMNIEADALKYDDIRQVSVFSGNVVLSKGSLLIRAAKVEVRQDPQGNQFGVATAEPGKTAYFKQKREGVDETIEGEGETIEYDSKADVVKFVKRAQMRRYRGSLLADETTGGVITYNNLTDVFTVDGGASNASPSNPTGRVRAMLTPRSAASTPEASGAGSTASTATATSPALKPSMGLAGDKK
jgi:lipopolysaccharide export system protein LptA